jgi:hypothetical protein
MTTASQPIASGVESEPSLEELFEELRKARTRGIGNRGKPLVDLAGLLYMARIISAESDDADKIEDALGRAVGRLGGKSTEAVEALLGLAADTQGLLVEDRRKRAAELYDYSGYETFRTRTDPALLLAVANHLQVLAAEQRLTEREARLIAYPTDGATGAGNRGSSRSLPEVARRDGARPVAVDWLLYTGAPVVRFGKNLIDYLIAVIWVILCFYLAVGSVFFVVWVLKW